MTKLTPKQIVFWTFLLGGFFTGVFAVAYQATSFVHTYLSYKQAATRLEILQNDDEYTNKASKLVDHYYKQGIPVSFSVIKDTLQAIDYYLPQYFPDGPFKSRDLIAFAMTESNFEQYAIGKAGEKGLFQIMEASSNAMGVRRNQFDIDTNTELALFVLRDKFNAQQDFRKAIIAYNGVVVRNGHLDDTYWKKFSRNRMAVDTMFDKPKKN